MHSVERPLVLTVILLSIEGSIQGISHIKAESVARLLLTGINLLVKRIHLGKTVQILGVQKGFQPN